MAHGAVGRRDAAAGLTRPPPLPRTHRPWARGWFDPLLAPMLRQRRLALAVVALGAAQVAVAVLGLPGVPCPMLHATGVPCPACGASRACAALLRGNAPGWLHMHAMAPLFLAAFALFVAAAALPDRPRDRLAAWIDRVERRTGVVKLTALLLLLYWLARLAYAPATFSQIMRAGAG